jgi:hypothetical protein
MNEMGYLVPLRGFDEDAFRWNRAYSWYDHGFQIRISNLTTQTVLHEARHRWQFNMVLGVNKQTQDTDGDFVPFVPHALDPLALRLKDDYHVSIGGSNPEAHYAGPNTKDARVRRDDPSEPGGTEERATQAERDASCFEDRAVRPNSGECPGLIPALRGATIEEPTSRSVSIRVNTHMEIAIRVDGESGADDGDPNERHARHQVSPIQGVPVVFSVTPPSADALYIFDPRNTPRHCAPQPTAVGITGDPYGGFPGKVSVDFMPITPGIYKISVTQWQLKPEGDGQGAIQTWPAESFEITVEVTP